MAPPNEPTNFLYPFIDAEEHDPSALLADLAASAEAKAAESLALRRSTLEANADLLDRAATEMARRFARAISCRANTSSNPTSLPSAVRIA